MASISSHEDEVSLRMSPLSNITIRKPLTPRSPEKPPVATKPKLAPPPPPKPSSLFLHLSKTSAVQSGNIVCTTVTKIPLESQCSSTKWISSTHSATPATQPKTEPQTITSHASTATEKPPLPTSPPRSLSRDILSPSSTSSLPASFRRKNISSSSILAAQSQIQVGADVSSDSSSHNEPPPSRPIQETSKTPPSTLPKPKVNKIEKPRPCINGSSVKTPIDLATTQVVQPLNHSTQSPITSSERQDTIGEASDLPPASESCQPDTQLFNQTKEPNHTELKGEMASFPSKPVSLVLKLPDSNKKYSPLETTAPSVDMPDKNIQVSSRTAPPPLPKNPPRGNIPRKARNSVERKTPTSEVKPVFPTNNLQPEEAADKSVTIQGHCVSFSNFSGKPLSECCGTDLQDCKKVLDIPKVAPKPLPRTRVSTVPLSPPAVVCSSSENTQETQHKNTNTPVELDYVEVYRGDNDDSACQLHHKVTVISSESVSSKYSKIVLGNSAISESIFAESNGIQSAPEAWSPIELIKNEEPETTSEMLREIEELLKTKLGGDLQLNSETVDFSQNSSQPEADDSCDSSSSSPVRPPRPKHQASVDKHKGSLESLENCLDSSSTECLASGDAATFGKKIPPKPKRSFVNRVNRSYSDVGDFKSSDTADNLLPKQPAEKPYLPPRLDSLRRSESLNSTTPPPLPPRNKPQSVIAPLEASSDAETVTSTTMNQDGGSDSSNQSSHSGTLSRSDKIRPRRHAPPPPPGPPKRSSTFSPGDVRLQKKEDSMKFKVGDGSEHLSAEQKSPQRRLSNPDSEQVYHEIADNIRTMKEDSPPPKLPVRSSQNVAQILKGDKKKADVQKTPEDQKTREKRAKNALVFKVTQSLGKIAKLWDPSSNEGASSRSYISSKTESEPRAVEEGPSCSAVPDFHHQPLDARNQGASLKVDSTPVSSTGTPDRPLSTISQHSSSSGNGESQTFDAQPLEEILSSESESEPEPDKEEIYAQRKAKKVFFIAREIMSSEHNFVDVLKLLNLDFRLHISTATEKLGQPVLPTEILNKILDLLPQLLTFNEDLLKDITGRVEKWEECQKISDIFVKKGPFLKLYSTYISNFENATNLLENATKKYPAFAMALKEFELSPRCANLALKHYMLKPIQRIPQYKLLLQDYLKNLSPASPDYKDTVTALNIVSEVADHANESMRQGDNVQNLLEIQRSLIGQFEVIQPGRVLVKKGELQKLSRKEMQPRMFILFNDVLLHTTATATGYKINNILPLTGMKVSFPKLEVYKFEFNIICVQRSFTLSASSSKEKEDWVTALQTSIETNAKKHHTFEAMKPGPQTSLHDKDFVLGSKAPLWVPDARVTMCMLCLVEFTLTWRRHHCRSCGRIVCSQCSDNKAPLRYLKNKPARVCDTCFDTLKAAIEKEIEENKEHSDRLSAVSCPDPSSPTSVDSTDSSATDRKHSLVQRESLQSLNDLLQRFQKIRVSNRKANTPNRPSVLKEVQANDEGSDISGYLRVYKSRKWKKYWFVLKGKVLYTYKASEDMAAIESMPLLGYEVTRLNSTFEGAEPDHLFELTHQNKQPLSNNRVKTIQRLIFSTDNMADTDKWVNILTEAVTTAFS